MLPFAQIHQWEAETRYPGFFSSDFEEACDAVARDWCQRMVDDPNLIGQHPWPKYTPKNCRMKTGRSTIS